MCGAIPNQSVLDFALPTQNERLGTITAELEEKAEASELQINSISSQYRSLLIEKEVRKSSKNNIQMLFINPKVIIRIILHICHIH